MNERSRARSNGSHRPLFVNGGPAAGCAFGVGTRGISCPIWIYFMGLGPGRRRGWPPRALERACGWPVPSSWFCAHRCPARRACTRRGEVGGSLPQQGVPRCCVDKRANGEVPLVTLNPSASGTVRSHGPAGAATRQFAWLHARAAFLQISATPPLRFDREKLPTLDASSTLASEMTSQVHAATAQLPATPPAIRFVLGASLSELSPATSHVVIWSFKFSVTG